jgi:hypothetical protein
MNYMVCLAGNGEQIAHYNDEQVARYKAAELSKRCGAHHIAVPLDIPAAITAALVDLVESWYDSKTSSKDVAERGRALLACVKGETR